MIPQRYRKSFESKRADGAGVMVLVVWRSVSPGQVTVAIVRHPRFTEDRFVFGGGRGTRSLGRREEGDVGVGGGGGRLGCV